MIHRRFNPALCLAWIVMGSTGTELGRQGNVYQEKTNLMANWVQWHMPLIPALSSQNQEARAHRQTGSHSENCLPPKNKKYQKKEKMRQTSISALVRLRQAGDCECKASLSYSETLPNNKPIKKAPIRNAWAGQGLNWVV